MWHATPHRRRVSAVYLVCALVLVGMSAWFAHGEHWLSVGLVVLAAVVVGWGYGVQLVTWRRIDHEAEQWLEICRQIAEAERRHRETGPHDAV